MNLLIMLKRHILLMLFTAVMVANYSYTKPTDQVAVEGETVTFICNVSNPAVVVTWNVKYEEKGSEMNMLLTG